MNDKTRKLIAENNRLITERDELRAAIEEAHECLLAITKVVLAYAEEQKKKANTALK